MNFQMQNPAIKQVIITIGTIGKPLDFGADEAEAVALVGWLINQKILNKKIWLINNF